MKLQEIRMIAKTKGIKSGNYNDAAILIREIQKTEGNFPCYGTARSGKCDQMTCLWRTDCLPFSLK